MANAVEISGDGTTSLPTPYNKDSFQKRLNQFNQLIRHLTLQDVQATPEERRQQITENLRFDQFSESIRALFGSDVKSRDLKTLYRKISTNPDAKVDWGELFGFFNKPEKKEPEFISEEVSVFMVTKKQRVGEAAGERCRRDVIQAMVLVPAIEGFITASRKGTVCIWNNKFKLLTSCELKEASWVTGLDYLVNMRRVIVCTERSICVWDYRAKNKSQCVFYIKPLDQSPQCITWIPYSDRIMEDTVLFGDHDERCIILHEFLCNFLLHFIDWGFVNLMTLTPTDFAVRTKQNKGTKQSSGPKAREAGLMTITPDILITKIVRRKLHRDRVVKIAYYPELRCFASSSPGCGFSFVLEEVERLSDNGPIRGMNVLKGVSAFTFSIKANIVATGGVDKIVRIWHPHIFTRPTGKLIGHLFTIVAIVCNERDQHLISLSAARVFRVWDLHTLTSLQVFTDNDERPGERRIYSLLFDHKYQRLLTGSSVVDAWPMTRAVEDTMAVPQTHDRPIVQVMYNLELNQLVTVCNESVIRVWEAESGVLVYAVPEPHGPGVDVTALALDASGYRLLSGAYNGSVKVFDFGAGHEVKKLVVHRSRADDDQSIVGLRYCIADRRYVVALGWDNTIKLLLDSNDSHHLTVLQEFHDVYQIAETIARHSTSSNPFSQQVSLPDIGSRKNTNMSTKYREESVFRTNPMTSMDQISASSIITGSQTGSLLFWDVERTTVKKIAYLPDLTEDELWRHVTMSETPRSVNGLLVLRHTTRRPDPAYIQRLLGRSKEQSLSSLENRSRRTADKNSLLETNEVVNGQPQLTKGASNVRRPRALPTLVSGIRQESTMDDPESHLLVVTYDPIVASCHEDGLIRFWDLECWYWANRCWRCCSTQQGTLLREVTPLTRNQGTPLTCLCSDKDANVLIAGDAKGYCVKWNVGEFLEDAYSDDNDLIKQEVYWHCHVTKLSSITYVDSISAVVTGASDGSVRVWSSHSGTFIGYFGQTRPFTLPDPNMSRSRTPVLPYDISEGPLAPVKAVSARQRIRASQRRDYPLVFKEDLWTPFRRTDTQFLARSQMNQPEDAKFFGALIKPRQEKLDSSTSGSARFGAVFRALPVYRVRTPDAPRAPISFLPPVMEERRNDDPHKLSRSFSISKKRKIASLSRRSTGRTSASLASSMMSVHES